MLKANAIVTGTSFVVRMGAVALIGLVLAGCGSSRQAMEHEENAIFGALQQYEHRQGRTLCHMVEADIEIDDQGQAFARYYTRSEHPYGNQDPSRRAAKLEMEDGRWIVEPDIIAGLLP